MKVWKHTYQLSLGVLFPAALLAMWEIAVAFAWLPRSQAVAPSSILVTALSLLGYPRFLTDVALSVLRVAIGVTAGAAIGIVFGLFTATHSGLRHMLSPTLGFLAGIPVIVWMPFWIMLFGTGEAFRVGLVAIATFFLVYSVTHATGRQTSRHYVDVLRIHQKSRAFAVRHVYLPACSGAILTALRVALAFGWVTLFFAEYAVSEAGSEGLGWFVANARAVGRIEDEFAGLFVLGMVAFVIDYCVAKLQQWTLRWSRSLAEVRG